MEKENTLILFEGKAIRKIWHNDQWYFSVVDIIEILTDSVKPKTYWAMMKKRELQPFTNCEPLKLMASDGRYRLTDCANTEGVLRIIMSVPSPKAEPLKQWMAQVSKERIEETENPELSYERMAEIYKAKGHTDEWIKERLQAIGTRKRLTDEWKERGVKEGQEYSILTATIAKETFGLTPSEHSQFKGLDKQNLRDHMTPIELILTSLSEESTRLIAISDDAKGFNENQEAAVKGGKYAGNARIRLEKQIKKPVLSPDNFLNLKGSEKKELKKDKK